MIIGHKAIRERLARSVERNACFQAYLFAGPESVGKFGTALEFASRLIGLVDGDPLVHPDIFVLAPEHETKKGVTRERDISASRAREASHWLANFPYSSKRKVLIVQDAHRLTETAQNALLKTIEEPPEFAVIVLVTHDLGKMLPTVLSRCQRVFFHLVTPSEISADLKEFANVPEGERFLIGLGRPGIVMRSLRDEEGFSDQVTVLKQLMSLSEKPLRERIAVAEACANHAFRTMRTMAWWVGGLHAQVLASSGVDTAALSGISKIEDALARMRRFPSSARSILDDFVLHW